MRHIFIQGKALVLLIALSAVAATGITAEKPILLGILEDVPGKYQGMPNSRYVRVAFQKSGETWKAFPSGCSDGPTCLKHLPSLYPTEVSWTIAFDGKNVGHLTTHAPAEFDFYSDVGSETITSSGAIPTVGKRSQEYAGFLYGSVYRPLVAVSQPYFNDPDNWKPLKLRPDVQASLRRQFRNLFPNVENCASPEENIGRPWQYRDPDIFIDRAYSSHTGWRLASLRLGDYRCDGPSETPSHDPFSSQWFVVDARGHIDFLAQGLRLVDAGDYDNDGNSELLFAIEGYDLGGYELFYDDFKMHSKFQFSYH